MRRIILFGIALCLTATVIPFLRAQEKAVDGAEKGGAVLYRLEGTLSQTMPMTLKRAVKRAKAVQASILIIEIDTPGGEIMLMERLRDMIFDASQEEGLETVAFIDPNADSAGALISMACQRLYMSPLGHIGSATPVTINPLAPLAPLSPVMPSGQEDMNRKIKSRTRAIFRATATQYGRNSDIAEAMVDPDIELILVRLEDEEIVMTRQHFAEERARLGDDKAAEISIVCSKGELLNMTAREALEWGFIDGIPENRDELIAHFLGLNPDQLWIVQRSWSEGLVHFLESIQFLLLIVGLLLLFIEYQIPGFGLPGILGLSCLAILFFNKYLAGLAEITEILMMIAGVGLLAVEIFVIPGTLVTGILGGILIIAGMILSFQPFIIPDAPWETDLLMDNIFYMSGSLLIVIVTSAMLTRFLPRTPGLRWLVLESRSPPGTLHGTAGSIDDVKPDLALDPGDTGVAKSDLRPAGKVLIRDMVIDAQSEGGFIDAGENVVIVRRTGNFTIVRKYKGDLT